MTGSVTYRTPQIRSPAGQLVMAGLVYLVVAWIVWSAASGDSTDARVWAPVGLALGLVAAWGARVLPGVALAAGVAAWLAGAPRLEIAGHVSAVVIVGWAGGALWRAILDAPGPRSASDRVLWLAPVAAGAAALSAVLVHAHELTYGASALVVVGRSIVMAWFGHVGITLVAAPLLWVWTRPAPRRAAKSVWSALVVLGFPVLLALGIWAPFALDTPRAALAFLAIPFVFLAAVRYEPRRTALVAATVAVIAVIGTLRGTGPFASTDTVSVAGLAGMSGGTTLLAVFVSTLWAERSQLRESLESSQRRWRDLVRSAPEIILSVNRTGVVQMTNHRGDGVLARLDAEGSIFDAVVPEHHGRLREKLDVVFWNGTDTGVELDVATSQGPPRTYMLQMGPLREGERVAAAMIIGQDVTERNRIMARLGEREARLRAVYDRSPVAIALLSIDGKVLEFNLALEQLLAAGDLSLDAYEMAQIVHPEDRDRWLERFGALARGARNRFEDEVRLVSRDGASVWTRVTVNAVRGEDGTARFCVAQWEDQSARHRATEAEQLADLRASEIGRLEEVNAWKSELLHIASHEIKNPLTPIRLQLDLMERQVYGPMTEKQDRAVRLMQGECERLGSLVTGILDAARVEANRLIISPREMDMANLVRDLSESFQPMADEQVVGLQVETFDDQRIIGDPERLGQVVVNLLSNAFKFTPTHGHVRLRARRAGEVLVVEVTDTGPGMDEEQQARLFQAFSQVHDVAAANKGGIGLGLYVCRGIVEAHGGRIWCQSEGPGRGSTFGFEVPVAGLPPESADAPQSTDGAPASNASTVPVVPQGVSKPASSAAPPSRPANAS